jgi:hypothetical protein
VDFNKSFISATICSTLALATMGVALADQVDGTFALDGQNTVRLSYFNGTVTTQPGISGAAQGNACHGLNKTASGYAQGENVSFIANDTPRTVYLFTGPSCDGFGHVGGSGQTTEVDNSQGYLGALLKSYYFR